MPSVREYNRDWTSLFYYDETSPSGLRRATDVYTGRAMHIKIVKKDSVAGTIAKSKEGVAKAWYVVVEGKHYLIHRIIWVLHNGSIDSELVVNHKDCNPLNNKISNLELTTLKGNARRRTYHRAVQLKSNNSTGFHGITVRVVWNGSRTKQLYYIIAAVSKHVKSFRFDPSNAQTKLVAIEQAKLWREETIKKLSTEENSYRYAETLQN